DLRYRRYRRLQCYEFKHWIERCLFLYDRTGNNPTADVVRRYPRNHRPNFRAQNFRLVEAWLQCWDIFLFTGNRNDA
ncbi:hypothetical protein Bhyg_05772, partial [Pseudolycoriella hygida]